MATATATTTSTRPNGKAPTVSLRHRLGFGARPGIMSPSSPSEAAGREPASFSSGYDDSDDEEKDSATKSPSIDDKGKKPAGPALDRVLKSPEMSASASDDSDDHSVSTPRGGNSRTPSANGSPRVSSSSAHRANGHKPSFSSSARAGSSERVRFSAQAPTAPTRRSAWSIDPAVGVALISPVGNWLTGGDHVKNLLLLLLLIYYLHQIIEVPWGLYMAARSHRLLKEPASVEATRAASELQNLELIYLACSLASPAIGAFLLKVVFGSNVISWFSTGVFVLATGIRPWSHLIERLSERTEDLQDILSENTTRSSQSGKIGAELDELHERLGKIERALQDTQNELKSVPRKADIFEYVDDALDTLDRAHRTHDRRTNVAREAIHARLATLEEMLVAVRTEQRAALAMGSPSSAGRSGGLWGWLSGSSNSGDGAHPSSSRHGRRSSNLGTIPEHGRWTGPGPAPVGPEAEVPFVPPRFGPEKTTWFGHAWDVVRIIIELILLPLRVVGISVKLSPRASLGR